MRSLPREWVDFADYLGIRPIRRHLMKNNLNLSRKERGIRLPAE
jgi:hypothetical protein